MQLFKSKPPTDAFPCDTALNTHQHKMEDLESQRRQRSTRQCALAADINAVAPCAEQIKQLQETIDAKRIGAAISGAPPPDVSAELTKLEHLERQRPGLTQRAEVARKACAQLQAESDALLQQYRSLQPQLNHLLLDALTERMVSFADELKTAEAAYAKVLRRIFLHACAIDELSTSNKLGVFVDAQRYEAHCPQLPRHTVFDGLCRNRFEAYDDYLRLKKEGEALIGKLLQGGDDEPTAQA